MLQFIAVRNILVFGVSGLCETCFCILLRPVFMFSLPLSVSPTENARAARQGRPACVPILQTNARSIFKGHLVSIAFAVIRNLCMRL